MLPMTFTRIRGSFYSFHFSDSRLSTDFSKSNHIQHLQASFFVNLQDWNFGEWFHIHIFFFLVREPFTSSSRSHLERLWIKRVLSIFVQFWGLKKWISRPRYQQGSIKLVSFWPKYIHSGLFQRAKRKQVMETRTVSVRASPRMPCHSQGSGTWVSSSGYS